MVKWLHLLDAVWEVIDASGPESVRREASFLRRAEVDDWNVKVWLAVSGPDS
jgi:hypothetical protein